MEQLLVTSNAGGTIVTFAAAKRLNETAERGCSVRSVSDGDLGRECFVKAPVWTLQKMKSAILAMKNEKSALLLSVILFAAPSLATSKEWCESSQHSSALLLQKLGETGESLHWVACTEILARLDEGIIRSWNCLAELDFSLQNPAISKNFNWNDLEQLRHRSLQSKNKASIDAVNVLMRTEQFLVRNCKYDRGTGEIGKTTDIQPNAQE